MLNFNIMKAKKELNESILLSNCSTMTTNEKGNVKIISETGSKSENIKSVLSELRIEFNLFRYSKDLIVNDCEIQLSDYMNLQQKNGRSVKSCCNFLFVHQFSVFIWC